MSKKATLEDIARELNISVATVHRALTNSGRISEKTKEMILKKAEEIDYQPNLIASRLSSKKNCRIAFLCPDNIFYRDIMAGAALAVSEHRIFGLTVDFFVTREHDPQEQIRQLTDIYEGKKYAAAALSPSHTMLLNPAVDTLAANGIPVVTFNNDISNSARSYFVGEDSYLSGQMAGELYDRILPEGASIAVMQSLVSAEGLRRRIDGFCDYIHMSGRMQIHGIYDYYDSIENSYDTARQLLAGTKVDAVFCNSMMGTVGTARALSRPDSRRAFMVGYDLNEEIRSYIENGVLAAILFQSPFRQGYHTIKTLYRLLTESTRSNGNDCLYIPTHLILKSNLKQALADQELSGRS